MVESRAEGGVVAVSATDNRSTRDRILDAALSAFADRGVEATSLDSLAAEIGVRKQTILYWFPSKEVLLLGVVDYAVAELGARLSEAAISARPGRAGGFGGLRRSVPAKAPTVAKPSDSTDPLTPSPPNSGALAANRRRFAADTSEFGGVVSLEDRLVAVVDATFRLGTTHPQLLAVVREVARVGPPASTHLAAAVDPLVDTAVGALSPGTDRERIRRVLLAAGARVVGMATEAEVRADLGIGPDLTWLRTRRRALIESLTAELSVDGDAVPGAHGEPAQGQQFHRSTRDREAR